MDASEIYPRRSRCERNINVTTGTRIHISSSADDTAKLSRRDHEFREPTPRREQPAGSEDFSGKLQGDPEGPQSTEAKDDAEARGDFWLIKGDFIYRHHSEPRVQLHVREEETFPILPMKNIDVTELPIQIWMCWKRNVLLMIIGLWT